MIYVIQLSYIFFYNITKINYEGGFFMPHSIEEIKNSIAYCGLICKLCHFSSTCDGCKSDFGCEEWEDCVHRKCCIEKNINGCWECEEAPCDKKMFANGHDI